MTKESKHLSQELRKRQIIIAADTVLHDVGVADFTIDQVVDSIGIAKGTIYKYFDTKFDLLAEVGVKALKLLLDYFKMVDNNPDGGLTNTKAIIMSCYIYHQSNPKYFELIIFLERPEFKTESSSYRKIIDELISFVVAHVKKQQKEGNIRKNLNPLHVNHFLWGSCMGMMNFLVSRKNLIEDEQEINRKDLMEDYADTIVAGLAA